LNKLTYATYTRLQHVLAEDPLQAREKKKTEISI